ncbi:MAG: magnesium transporter [Candidatus Thorarchaeota archaeon]
MGMANGTLPERTLVWRIYREAMPVLLFTVLAELFAGALLVSLDISFASLIGLFILIPGLMQLRGNISTSLAQRLGSGTHLGTISWDQGLNKPLRANIKAAFYLVLIMSFALAIGAWFVSMVIQATVPRSGLLLHLFHFLIIALVTALLASSVQVTITVTVALLAHARGLDPDNITIPIVAAIGDIITIGCLIVAISLALTLLPPIPIFI